MPTIDWINNHILYLNQYLEELKWTNGTGRNIKEIQKKQEEIKYYQKMLDDKLKKSTRKKELPKKIEDMSIPQLIQYAKIKGIEGYSNKKKEDILRLINEHKKQEMQKNNYYLQLKHNFKLLEFIETFKDDFRVHDKEALYNYKGDFLLAVRKTGTNLLLLRKDDHLKKLQKIGWNEAESLGLWNEKKAEMERYEAFVSSFNVWIKKENSRFFWGANGVVKEVSRDNLDSIFKKYQTGKLFA